MKSRTPRFHVITSVLVALAGAALCIKIAARYLPERQPNRLSLEYGTYVKSAAREKVDWYPLSEEPFNLARRTNKLIFLDIGSIDSRSANNFQRQHLEDDEFTRMLNNYYISIKCDIREVPWLKATLQLNSPTFERFEGCLLVALSKEGEFIEESPVRRLRTAGNEMGVYEWLEDLARKRVGDKAALDQMVQRNASLRRAAALAVQNPGPVSADTAYELAARLRQRITDGTLLRAPFYVSPTLPEMLAYSALPDGQSAAANWLLQLAESACYDHVNGGFFMQSMQPLWKRPGYGKLTGVNAQLCALYATASNAFSAPFFGQIARRTAKWLLSMQDKTSKLFYTGLGTDEEVLDGSKYYDWPPGSLSYDEAQWFEIESIGGASGPPRMQPQKDWRQAVSADRARRDELFGKRRAQEVKSRIPPKLDDTLYANVNGQVIAGLFRAGLQLNDNELISAAKEAYAQAIRIFVQGFGDVLHAPGGLAQTTGYAGDYVWLIRAAIENYLATADPQALAMAERITARFVELFQHPAGGYETFLNSQLAFAPFALPTLEIADEQLPSINAVAARNFLDLATITGKSDYSKRGLAALTAFGGAVSQVAEPPAGYILALQSAFRTSLLIRGKFSPALTRKFPLMFCTPSPPNRIRNKPGIYIERQGILSGPYSISQLSATYGVR